MFLLPLKTHVEPLFGRKIMALQSEWVSEFQVLSPILAKCGIVHRVSCPYTHKQNNIVYLASSRNDHTWIDPCKRERDEAKEFVGMCRREITPMPRSIITLKMDSH
jgi:hypothetical protein